MGTDSHLQMRDVAKLAGVSPATVSRVLGGYANVSSETRERVLAVVARFDYQPNRLAKHLRRGRTDLVGVVVSDIENPYFATLVRVVEDAVYRRGIRVLLCNTSENAAKQASYLQVMAGERVSGVLLSPSDPDDAQIGNLLDLGIPLVAIDRAATDPRTDSVTAGDVSAARQATRLLIENGHRRIGFITRRTEVQTGADRLSGYRKAMADAGLKQAASVGSFTIQGGTAATEELLAEAPHLTALIVANNQMALGALRVLRTKGIRIPEQVAMVAFDDPPWAALIEPPLTTLARPLRAMVEAAVSLLFERMGGSRVPPAHPVFQFELRVRSSCGTTPRAAGGIDSSCILPWEPG